MLNQIQQFLKEHLTFSAADTEEQLKLASIALFLEMVIIDNHADPAERALVLSMVQTSFALSEEQATNLIAAAEQQREQATDYFEFTFAD
jgi:uncharacterized tellurite resistance protein B-like protein